MKSLSLLLAGTAMLSSTAYSNRSASDSPKGLDDYNYTFESDNSFEKTNGDEFDNNFYNENYISFQIQHSGIDGTIRGFKEKSDIQPYLER